jgi:hypothetical protein
MLKTEAPPLVFDPSKAIDPDEDPAALLQLAARLLKHPTVANVLEAHTETLDHLSAELFRQPAFAQGERASASSNRPSAAAGRSL